MSPHESTAIAELTEEIRGYRRDVAVLHTKLFGDEDSENPQGRIPRLEATQVKHNEQIGRMVRREWMVRGMALLIGAIVTAAGFIYDVTNFHKGH